MAAAAFDRQKFGEDIAFGVEQTIACWATDFIDPWVGAKVQEKLEPKVGNGNELKYAWAGEIAGDLAAFFSFVGAQRFMPQLSQGIKSVIKPVIAPMYERSGHKSVEHWAREHNVSTDSTEYHQKLEEYKDFQTESLAKSTVVAAGSIGFNVATQKAIGNPHKLWVITAAKVAGASLTVGLMMGMRYLLPRTMHNLDEELGERYFSPVARNFQKMFGGQVTEAPSEERHHHGHDHHHEAHKGEMRDGHSPVFRAGVFEEHAKNSHADSVLQSREIVSSERTKS